MNNNYYPNTMPNTISNSSGTPLPTYDSTKNKNAMYNVGLPIDEQSYIENILRLNRGKKVKAYVSYPDSLDWKDSIYNGIIEQAGRDHLIISNPETGKWYLILMIYLNFVEFDEKINYTI